MSTTRATFKHASVYTLAAVMGKMISFFLLPFYAHILGREGYGVIGMTEMSLAFLMSLMAYGVQSAVIRFYHDRPPGQKKAVVSTGMIQVVVFSLLLTVPLMIFSRPLAGWLLGDPNYGILLVLALLGFVAELTGMAAASILLIEQRSVMFTANGLVRLIVGVGTGVWFVIILRWDLYGYYLSGAITSLLSSVWFVVIAIRRCGIGFDREISWDLIRFQLPLVPGNLASFVSRQAERFLVRFQIGVPDLGVLEMGYRFPALIGLIITQPFMRSWNTTRTEIAEDPGAREHIGRVFTWFLLLMASAGLVIAVNIPAVLRLLTPPEFWAAHRIARIEIVTIILQGIYFHTSFGLYYAKDTRTMSWIRGVCSVVKVGMSVLFIKLWGLYGAAWSGAIIQGVMVAWGGPVSQRRYAIRYEWKKIALIVAAGLGVLTLLEVLPLHTWGFYAWLRDGCVPAVGRVLAATPLGTWKGGKAVALFDARADILADLILRTLLCLPYAVLLPVLHYETRMRLLAPLRVGRRR